MQQQIRGGIRNHHDNFNVISMKMATCTIR